MSRTQHLKKRHHNQSSFNAALVTSPSKTMRRRHLFLHRLPQLRHDQHLLLGR